jgi:transposase
MLRKSRNLMVRQRTMLINALRGHLAEYGIVTGGGAGRVTTTLKALHERQNELPLHPRSALHGFAAQLRALGSEIDRLEAQITAWHRSDQTSRRLATDPGYRSDHGVCSIGGGARCIPVPIRASVRSLAGACASSKQIRRQGKAWRDHLARRWLPSTIAGGRRDNDDADDAQKSRSAALDGAAPRQEACESRDRRARQQNSADRLGGDVTQRSLSGRARVTVVPRSRQKQPGQEGVGIAE